MDLVQESTVKLNMMLQFRLATEADLPLLEWYGQFTHFRRLYHKTYQDQCDGIRQMLLADLNGFPIGQIFILLNFAARKRAEGGVRGYLYALRVLDHMRCMGIGTYLIEHAEQRLTQHGYQWSTISVAKTNVKARRLYERLGYCIFRDDPGRWHYVNHVGKVVDVNEPCWMLEKQLKSV